MEANALSPGRVIVGILFVSLWIGVIRADATAMLLFGWMHVIAGAFLLWIAFPDWVGFAIPCAGVGMLIAGRLEKNRKSSTCLSVID